MEVALVYRQHLAVIGLRAAAKAKGLRSVKAIAEELHYEVVHFRRKVRGEVATSEADLLRWALAYPKAKVLPGSDELLPKIVSGLTSSTRLVTPSRCRS